MERYRVYVTDDRHKDYRIEEEMIRNAGGVLKVLHCETEEDMIRQCADADALLLNLAPLTGRVVESLKKCKVVSRYGVGYDNVDVEACTRKGIVVANVPDYCEEDVSDCALALMLACMRGIAKRDRLIRQGLWNIQGVGFRMKGKTLGLLGFGRIAQALARKCSGLGLEKILVYDPYLSKEACREKGVKKAELSEVLAEADILSLHMPVTEETRGMINAKTLAQMKQSAILINTARGALVEDEALLAALKAGRLLGAGLDTHNQEPLGGNSPYLELDNVVLTDHTAYGTEESVAELKTKAAENIVKIFHGEQTAYAVN